MSMKGLTEKQRQWLWFFGLAAAGMAGMLMLAGLVKMVLKIGG